jgi:hypothetical protein
VSYSQGGKKLDRIVKEYINFSQGNIKAVLLISTIEPCPLSHCGRSVLFQKAMVGILILTKQSILRYVILPATLSPEKLIRVTLVLGVSGKVSRLK